MNILHSDKLLVVLQQQMAMSQAGDGVKNGMKRLNRTITRHSSNHILQVIIFGLVCFTVVYLWSKLFRRWGPSLNRGAATCELKGSFEVINVYPGIRRLRGRASFIAKVLKLYLMDGLRFVFHLCNICMFTNFSNMFVLHFETCHIS